MVAQLSRASQVFSDFLFFFYFFFLLRDTLTFLLAPDHKLSDVQLLTSLFLPAVVHYLVTSRPHYVAIT